jgi:NADPH-dependent 2,4-dienoyl-CoA reductase/sulfur reductase-like enzyme
VIECDLAVVGAGPAGLAAAGEAAAHGLSVVVLDDNARPGGQYFRQLP